MRLERAEAPPELEHDQRKKVVIADDDRTVRNVISRVLELKNFIVVVAASGEECMEYIDDCSVDAFLLDVYMPGIDGLTICRALRNSQAHIQTPVLCMTAAGETTHVNAAFAAGADDFIVKPVNPNVLDARLRGQIERYENVREHARLRANLDRYISRRTRQMVSEFTETGILPAPQEAEVCVLFSDVRGFTQLSQDADPKSLFASLSHNLGLQVDAVYRHGGYVDKFAGDGIMAIFDEQNKTQAACRCALEILELTSEAGKYQRDPVLRLGIGIHSGTALIGNVGSELHFDYSVIGETVNLAARLCGTAAPMTAVISAAAVADCGPVTDMRFNAPCTIDVRGVREPVAVYQLERLPGPVDNG